MPFNLSHTAQDLDAAVTKANAAAPQSTTYTKSETDTLLADKVDKVTGKGLSTNDFTDAYKSAVDGAAPQSTTYTKTEIDNMIGDINTVLEEVL